MLLLHRREVMRNERLLSPKIDEKKITGRRHYEEINSKKDLVFFN